MRRRAGRDKVTAMLYECPLPSPLGTLTLVADDAALVAVLWPDDRPGLRADHLTQAFALLAEHDVVLGPATDGGYYLLGLRQPRPELFLNKEWSTDSVLVDTIADAQRLGCRVALLPELRDVDTADDLATWRAEIPV